MFEPKTFVSKVRRRFFSVPADQPFDLPKQRRLMLLALTLLLAALTAVLYHDRDFWFPEALQADDSETVAPRSATPDSPSATPERAVHPPPHRTKTFGQKASDPPKSSSPPIIATATRTVLPPLEVEVVAGDEHQTLQPPSNAVNIEVEPDLPPQKAADAPWGTSETAADVTSDAADRMEVSADTSDVVSRSVKPGYPLLARQMKVQGSVVLLAMIGRDGSVQDLRVLSGPTILATAAREAVQQWHFKPHYEGTEPVETVAKVTVNFTISTN